jgi:signal transduction histidine kinase/ligand-binding sensor domain-containing protein
MHAFPSLRRPGWPLLRYRRTSPNTEWDRAGRGASCILALTLAFAAALAHAAPEVWKIHTWHVEEGLPDNRIVGLALLPDGYLCVATREGLVTFNGAAFQEFNVANPSGVSGNGIRAMFIGRQGDLWLDMFRETLVRVGPSSMQVYTAHDGVPPGDLTNVAEDREGHTWLAIGGRTCEVEGERLRSLTFAPTSLGSDVRGRVWCVVDHQLGILSHAGFEPRFAVGGDPVLLASAQSGGLWICAGQQLSRMYEAAAPAPCVPLPPGIRPSCLLEDRDGAVWLGTVAHGVMRFAGQAWEAIETPRQGATSLVEDREGNIWLGSAGGGLSRLRPRVTKFVGPSAGPALESVASVCEDDRGRVWVVTSSGQLARGEHDAWTIETWPGPNVTGVAADQQGTLWVGTRGQGLHQASLLAGTRRTWRREDGLPSNVIRSLFVAADNSLWFATEEPAALGHITAGRVHVIDTPKDVRTFRAIVQRSNGEIWVGTSDGRTLKVAGNALIAESIVTDATQTSVRCLHATPDGSLWIGYAGRGIGWLKGGHFTVFSTNNGLLDDSVWQIIADRAGSIWITSPHGLSRVTMADAEAVAAGRQTKLRPTLFGRGEGFAGFVGNYNNIPAACRTDDGRILFATSQGLLEVNPETIRANPLPPPVMLERVIVDEAVFALGKWRFPSKRGRADAPGELVENDAVLRLPPDHRRLAFDFAALSYSAPENVRFRYRLDNFDNVWTETASEHSARYSRLPAGHYLFRVVACNDMGVWNETGASLAIVVSPFFWQTWWFRIGLASAFTAAVILVVRLVSFRRLRRKLQVAEQHAALSHERARIAQDIHDDLGGSLSHIKLLSELAVQDRFPADPPEKSLRQITATARQMLKSLDEIVWAINPRNDTLPSLISYLGQHAVEFLRAAGVRCVIDLPDNPPEITVPSDLRHHVFLLVKEALTNVVRHAQARTVHLEVKIEAGSLQVSIEDDGCGFDYVAGDSHGNGLRNMRKRMAALAGEFEMKSQSGAGTRVRLKVRLPGAVVAE